MLNIEELDRLKTNVCEIILQATNFMIEHGMDTKKTKVRSTSPAYEKYGIWPTTEFLEFLLTNDVIPITPIIVNSIEGMVDFIIEKYSQKEKKWPLTDAEGSIASAITSGHCIYVLKLYISRPFVDYTKTETIRRIIREAEETLITDCRRDGSWKILDGDDALDVRMNFGRFFYTYNAWFGIRKVHGYSDDLANIPSTKTRLSEYVINVSDKLLREFDEAIVRNDVAKLSSLLCNIAKAIQILNDYSETNCEEKKRELCNSVLQIAKMDKFNDILSTVTPVEISELPNSGYTTFKNFPYFDLFFAVKDVPSCLGVVHDIINLYIEGEDRDKALNCWWHQASNANTWPTCEALLVLSQAHASFFATAIKHNCKQELDNVKEKYKECDECKRQIIDYLKPEKKQFQDSTSKYIRNAKGRSWISMAITIFVAVCAVAALITLSIITELYWLNTLITAAVIPVVLQIIFIVKMPEYIDVMQDVQKTILETIDEKEEMWKSE